MYIRKVFGTKRKNILIAREKDSLNYNPTITVKTYTTTKQKISKNINALDSNNNILKAVAIADICIDEYWVALEGYEVLIRTNGKQDPGLKVYLKKDDIWEETNILVKYRDHKYGKYYSFQVEEQTGCFSFCLGKPAKIKRQKDGSIQPDSYKPVYISTYKPFNFEDISVKAKKSALFYSAKLNDTLMAFTLPAKQSAGLMVFEGYYTENGVAKQLTVPLRKCGFTRDKSGNEWYYITEESLLQKEPEKKKGFWQWLKNLF